MRLFHVSESPSITHFAPRMPDPGRGDEPVVWAVDEAHLPNYLLPRDCPRVTYYALPESAPVDVERLLGAARSVVTIEGAWLERAIGSTLYIYRLAEASFQCVDAGAGYFTSREAVTPLEVRRLDNPLLELARLEVELRVVPSLWPLRDAVLASSLQFSFIRMRNAQAPDGPGISRSPSNS